MKKEVWCFFASEEGFCCACVYVCVVQVFTKILHQKATWANRSNHGSNTSSFHFLFFSHNVKATVKGAWQQRQGGRSVFPLLGGPLPNVHIIICFSPHVHFQRVVAKAFLKQKWYFCPDTGPVHYFFPIMYSGANRSFYRCWQRQLCEERPGLPWVGHSWLQSAPITPPQGMAEPHRQRGGTLGKACFSKGKIADRQEGEGDQLANQSH